MTKYIFSVFFIECYFLLWKKRYLYWYYFWHNHRNQNKNHIFGIYGLVRIYPDDQVTVTMLYHDYSVMKNNDYCPTCFQEKCDHYWPYDSEPMYYGDLQVQITGETKDVQNPEMEYIMSDLQISQVSLSE